MQDRQVFTGRGATINPDLIRQQQGMAPGSMGAGNMMGGMGMMQSPADVMRAQLSAVLSSGGQGGGFNWNRGGIGMIYDDALKSIMSPTDEANNPDNNTFLMEKAVPGMQVFTTEMRVRAGNFFEQYKAVREQFRCVERYGQNIQDPVQSAYIDDVNKQPDMTRVLGFTAAPMFGYMIVQVLRKVGPEGRITPQNYYEAVAVSCRNALYFEFISWLINTQKGREMIPMLAPETKAAIDKLERNKELASVAFEFWGQTLPWAKLEFKVPTSSRPDYNILYGSQNGYPDPAPLSDIAARYSHPDPSDLDESMQLVFRNANLRKQGKITGAIKIPEPSEPSHYVGDIPVNYNTMRKDWENLTKDNRDEFRTRRLFHNIGKPGIYFVSEGDWKRVQRAYTRHPEQGAEETVVRGTYRVVYINLDKDDGWISTIVRAEDLSMEDVLTNPAKLLPLLEDPEADSHLAVTVYPVGEVAAKGSLEVPIETARKLEKGIPVVTINETITSDSSKKLEHTMLSVNEKTTKEIKGESATSFNIINWDKYVCSSESDRTVLFIKAPYLFKDGKHDNPDLPKTFFQQVVALSNLAINDLVDGSLMEFIERHLTREVNGWLANIGGFDVKGDNVLSVDNIFDEIRQLSDYLKENDRELYGALHDPDKPHHLKRAMSLFVYKHESRARNTDSESLVATVEEELDLYAQRQFFVAVINGRQGPAIPVDGNPVTIKRSRFPEYFDLVEKAFPATMGLEMDMEEVDKLFLYEATGNIWAFNFSAIDRNVATLRQVNRSNQLVMMRFS